MSAADTVYTPRFSGHENLVRGRDNICTCPVYRDGALVAPTVLGSSCIIYRADGSVQGTKSITIPGNIARVTITEASLASEAYSDWWRLDWSLLMPDGVVHVFTRSAALGRRALYPVVTDLDLFRRHSDLVNQLPSGHTSYQSWIDEAWAEVVHRIRQKGSLPHLVCAPEDLRFVLLYETLANIYRDFISIPGDTSKWQALKIDYDAKAQRAWAELALRYDSDEDGHADEQRPATPVTFLGASGDWWT